MSYCKKCYVDSKKAGIIEENGVYFLGSFVTAWNDGTAPVGNRFGFLKFSRLNAGNYADSVAEIENRFGKVAEEGTSECILTTYSRTGRAKQVTKYLPEYCFEGPYRSYDRV